jgi:hypothetical protein
LITALRSSFTAAYHSKSRNGSLSDVFKVGATSIFTILFPTFRNFMPALWVDEQKSQGLIIKRRLNLRHLWIAGEADLRRFICEEMGSTVYARTTGIWMVSSSTLDPSVTIN